MPIAICSLLTSCLGMLRPMRAVYSRRPRRRSSPGSSLSRGDAPAQEGWKLRIDLRVLGAEHTLESAVFGGLRLFFGRRWLDGLFRLRRSDAAGWKPVAMTVTLTSSPSSRSIAAPKTISASGSTTSWMTWAACVDLLQAEVLAADDVEQHAAGALDADVEQRAGDRGAGGIGGAVLAAAAADRQQRRAGLAHDPAHVGEVEVDDAGQRDDLGDALDALAQDVVGGAEGVLERRLGVADGEQAVVGDDDQRVDLAPGAPRCPPRRAGPACVPSKLKGFVTTPMVSAPDSRATSATRARRRCRCRRPCRR